MARGGDGGLGRERAYVIDLRCTRVGERVIGADVVSADAHETALRPSGEAFARGAAR